MEPGSQCLPTLAYMNRKLSAKGVANNQLIRLRLLQKLILKQALDPGDECVEGRTGPGIINRSSDLQIFLH